jgi:hypothetical protein
MLVRFSDSFFLAIGISKFYLLLTIISKTAKFAPSLVKPFWSFFYKSYLFYTYIKPYAGVEREIQCIIKKKYFIRISTF